MEPRIRKKRITKGKRGYQLHGEEEEDKEAYPYNCILPSPLQKLSDETK